VCARVVVAVGQCLAGINDKGLKDNYKDNNRDNYKDHPGAKEIAIPQAHNEQNKFSQSLSLGIALSIAPG
jgi:hypothetical protein